MRIEDVNDGGVNTGKEQKLCVKMEMMLDENNGSFCEGEENKIKSADGFKYVSAISDGDPQIDTVDMAACLAFLLSCFLLSCFFAAADNAVAWWCTTV